MEGSMEGRTRDRPKIGMIDDPMEETYAEMKRKAKDREK